MLESYLRAGNQVWNPHTVPTPDQSITDGCLAWEETAMLLDVLSEAVQLRKKILVE